jgi:hypothetical protein
MLRALFLTLLAFPITAHARQDTPAVEPAPADGVDVIVVKRGSGEALPGALVSFLDTSDRSSWQVLDDTNDAAEYAQSGRHYRADESGRTRVPFTDLTASVRAASGEWIGRRTIDMWDAGETLPLRIEAEIEQSQAVLAVDADGRPRAGLRVAVTVDGGDERSVFVAATTGADGIARLPHMQRLFCPNPTFTGPRVAFDYATQRGRNPGVPLERLTSEPVRLVVPMAGSLRVRAKGPKGAPLSGPVHVSFIILPFEKQAGSDARLMTIDAAGKAEAFFPLVGLCDSIEVLAFPGPARSYTGQLHAARREIAGPKRTGHEVTVDLEFPTFEPWTPDTPQAPPWRLVTRGTTLLKGRVLDAEGRPVPRAAVGCVERVVEDARATPPVIAWHRVQGVLPVTTGANGSFDLFRRDPEPDPTEPEAEPEAIHGQRPDLRVTVQCPGYVTPAPIALLRGGPVDIRLAREARLVGRLHDPSWAGLEHASIQLEYEESTEHTQWLVLGPKLAPGHGPGDARRGLGGRFEWNGLPPGKVKVTIQRADAAQPSLEITGIEIAAGQIVADARLADLDLRRLTARGR